VDRLSLAGIPITYLASLAPEAIAEVERTAGRHRTLEQVLDWCRAQTPPIWVDELITQDEFTHDVVVRFGELLYLVYDVT
jgi:hypothetical protein